MIHVKNVIKDQRIVLDVKRNKSLKYQKVKKLLNASTVMKHAADVKVLLTIALNVMNNNHFYKYN